MRLVDRSASSVPTHRPYGFEWKSRAEHSRVSERWSSVATGASVTSEWRRSTRSLRVSGSNLPEIYGTHSNSCPDRWRARADEQAARTATYASSQHRSPAPSWTGRSRLAASRRASVDGAWHERSCSVLRAVSPYVALISVASAVAGAAGTRSGWEAVTAIARACAANARTLLGFHFRSRNENPTRTG